MHLINRMLSAIKMLEIVASTIAGAALFIIMFIVCIDVVGRYVFNSPLTWSYDLISMYLLVVSFFFALSDTLRRKYHVNVDILVNLFSNRTQIFWNAIGWSLSSILFCVMTFLLAQTAYSDWVQKNVIGGAVSWPIWIGAAIASIGMLLICIRLVLGSMIYTVAFFTGESDLCNAVTDPSPALGTEYSS